MSNDDRLTVLARQRVITASAELELALSEKQGGGTTIEILRRLKERAAESMAGLIEINFCDPSETARAVTLQNEVKRYDEWLAWIEEIISEGKSYDQAMKEDEREELLDYLMQSQDGRKEAVELGLIDDVHVE